VLVFIARQNLSRVRTAMLAGDINIVICLSVRLSVKFGTVSKRLNISSQFRYHTVAQLFYFYKY